MKKKVVGIIGCGTIGSALVSFLQKNFSGQLKVAYLCDHHPEKAQKIAAALKPRPKFVSTKELIKRSDFIIEAASTEVASEVLKGIASSDKEAFILSVGGLIREAKNIASSKKFRGKVWVPSGAIAGVDGILAARESGLKKVKLITRKPPAGLKTAPYFEKKKFPTLKGRKEVCVFAGSAKVAIKAFPQNVNVAAILSLAGLGFSKTKVEIWTSASYRRNQHEIEVDANSGSMQMMIRNVPSKRNPKTSALAIYGAQATLRKVFSPVRIGT